MLPLGTHTQNILYVPNLYELHRAKQKVMLWVKGLYAIVEYV